MFSYEIKKCIKNSHGKLEGRHISNG